MSSKKTPVQLALINLRKKLCITQQQLATAMNVSTVSVCRWETIRPPTGTSLADLASFAEKNGAPEEAALFGETLFQGDPKQRVYGFRSARLRESAALRALAAIQADRNNPAVRRGRIQILRTLVQAHALLVQAAIEGGLETEACRDLQRTHQDLVWELEDEEKRTPAQKR